MCQRIHIELEKIMFNELWVIYLCLRENYMYMNGKAELMNETILCTKFIINRSTFFLLFPFLSLFWFSPVAIVPVSDAHSVVLQQGVNQVHEVAACLKLFFRSLKDPLLMSTKHQLWIDNAGRSNPPPTNHLTN